MIGHINKYCLKQCIVKQTIRQLYVIQNKHTVAAYKRSCNNTNYTVDWLHTQSYTLPVQRSKDLQHGHNVHVQWYTNCNTHHTQMARLTCASNSSHLSSNCLMLASQLATSDWVDDKRKYVQNPCIQHIWASDYWSCFQLSVCNFPYTPCYSNNRDTPATEMSVSLHALSLQQFPPLLL